MAKKKIQREVEQRGLDPCVPHSLLGSDGRLMPPTHQIIENPVLVAAEIVVTPEEIVDLSISPQTVTTEPEPSSTTDSVSTTKKRGRKPRHN